MSLQTKLPEDFIVSLGDIPGLNVDALLNSLDEDASVAIRFNRRKLLPGEVPAQMYPGMKRVEWCDDGYYLDERPVFTLNPLLHAGVFYVQDASSMIYQQIIEKLLSHLDNGEPKVLDFCAAPGGKTTAIINALPDESLLVANEYVAVRGKILRENLEKWGFPNIITTSASSGDYSGLGEVFDIIAVDAPCSGEGMMRKEEEARRQWSPRLTVQCATLQREILADVVNCLKPGGYLIYSTCTFNLLEDEGNALYIADELGLEPLDIDALSLEGIEKVGRTAADPKYSKISALRFMPHLTQGEGLFVAIFRKPENWCAKVSQSEPRVNFAKKSFDKSNRKGRNNDNKNSENTSLLKRNLGAYFDREMLFDSAGDVINAYPSDMQSYVQLLRDVGIRITGAGLPVATLKGKDVVPDSRLTLSMAYRPDALPSVELGLEDALRFLRRESFALPESSAKGYIVVKYKGHPLGIMKNLGTRANNLYPQSWKIKHL